MDGNKLIRVLLTLVKLPFKCSDFYHNVIEENAFHLAYMVFYGWMSSTYTCVHVARWCGGESLSEASVPQRSVDEVLHEKEQALNSCSILWVAWIALEWCEVAIYSKFFRFGTWQQDPKNNVLSADFEVASSHSTYGDNFLIKVLLIFLYSSLQRKACLPTYHSKCAIVI